METNDAVNTLAALAQVSRLGIYRLLVQAGPAGMAVGNVAETLGIPAATLLSLGQYYESVQNLGVKLPAIRSVR